jgi:hypothetical protein
MLLTTIPASADSVELSGSEMTKVEQQASTVVEQPQLSATAQILSEDCKILNYVHAEVFSSANHVARLTSEETLSSYVFLNEDGTRTAYFMDEAVKFVDANGIIQEKDLTLVPTVGGYTTEKNDIELTLPTDPSRGITLLWNNTAVRIIPQGGTLGEAVVEDNTVRYVDYYGNGADLVYTPTLSGLKEDIILESYAGKNTFTFMLNTGGLRLYSANGRYFLAASKTATERIELGDVVSFDARGRFSVGTMTAQTVTAGQIYRLTLTVDEAFLTDPNTVYPVSIDPTLEVSDNNAAGSIEDVSIYQGKPTTNGNWTYLHSGYYDSNYTVSRTLFRLTGLIRSSVYQELNANQVSSAEFHIWEASGTATTSVYLRANDGREDWSESGATWKDSGVVLGTIYDTENLVSNSEAVFDITQLVKDWKSGTQNIQKGFVLQSSNETSRDKAFYSSEHSNTARRPYVVMNYITHSYTIGLVNTVLTLNEGNTCIIGKQTVPSGLDVEWTSSDTSVATVDEDGVVTAKKAGTITVTASAIGADPQTCTVYVTIADGVYYLQNVASSYRLDAGGTSISSTTNIRQHLKCISGMDVWAQLWRIHYLGSGVYSIRPLHRSKMGLHVSSSDVDICNIGTADTYYSVTSTARWTITYNTDGYIFKCNGSDSQVLTPSNGSTSNNATIDAAIYSADSRAQRWRFEPAPDIEDELILYDISTGTYVPSYNTPLQYFDANQTLTLPEIGFEVAFASLSTIDQSVIWSTSDSSVANINANTGTVVFENFGEATITVTKNYNQKVHTRRYKIRCCTNGVYVNVLYDNGYTIRYRNAINRINEHMVRLQNRFLEEYGIYIFYSTPINFVSYADECTSKSGIYSVCNCGDCFDSEPGDVTLRTHHHTNMNNILLRVPAPDISTSTTIAFIGNRVCSEFVCQLSEDSLVYQMQPANGLTVPPVGICTIFNFDSEDDEFVTLVHEFGHLFGVLDHYDDYYGTAYYEGIDPSYDSACIYGEGRIDPGVRDSITICNGCLNLILDNLDRYMP